MIVALKRGAPILVSRLWIAGLAVLIVSLSSCSLGRHEDKVSSKPVPWGTNLCPNSSFEQADADGKPAGWTLVHRKGQSVILSVAEEGCAGARCLAMDLKLDPAQKGELPAADALSPVIPTPTEGWYLVSLWARLECPSNQIPTGIALAYVDRLPGGSEKGESPVYFYFNPWLFLYRQWRCSFLVIHQRPGQTGLQLRVPHHGPYRFLMDQFQVRKLAPVTAVSSPTESRIVDGCNAERVMDPDAWTQMAWKVTEGRQERGAKIMGGVRNNEEPGVYVARYRFKQEAPGQQGIQVSLTGSGGQTLENILPGDFMESGRYQDFPVYFVYPFGGGSFYTWNWLGQGAYCFDYIALDLIRPLSYREGWDLLYTGVDAEKVCPPCSSAPTQSAPVPGRKQAWLAYGLYTDHYQLPQALASAGLDTRIAWASSRRQLVPSGPDFKQANVVVISDVPASLFHPAVQMQLRDFVEKGGGLVVAGGLYGFGYGGLKGTFIEDALPVRVVSTFDLIRLSSPVEVKGKFGKPYGKCAWAHTVNLRSGAQVVLKGANLPLLVRGQYGKGRVVAILATPLGEPENAFWKTEAWREELKRQIQWAAGL